MVVKLDSGFEILKFSDLEYDQMTVEIQYRGEQLVQINKDKGLDNLEMEIFTEFTNPEFIPKFQVNDFLIALDEAKKLLND